MSDLVERLVADATYCATRIAATIRQIGRDCDEAAARITALEAENARLKAREAELVERNSALALQADEWEGKYAIVSEANAALGAIKDAAGALALSAGKRNVALDGEAKYRAHRQAVLAAMQNFNNLIERPTHDQ